MADVTPDDRRIAPRLRPALGTTCRFDAVEGKPGPASGLVWNISLTGVSILVGTTAKLGEILTGELALDDGKTTMPVLLRVVHNKTVPLGDYLMGAQFLRELTPAELEQFVDPNLGPATPQR